MIIGTGLTKTFTGESLFENVDFRIGNNRKIALVGKNGCGKSTLLKIIVGELEADAGHITTDGDKIGYIPQEFTFPNELVGEYLEKKLDRSWDFYKVEQLLAELDFANFDPYQELSTLSEGQKMKIKLLEVLLENPDILLIDEPTNHLDIEGIMWFEKYIGQLAKTVVMISHDREFLNNTVDEIWELENKKLLTFVGNYDYYKEEKLKLIGKWDAEYTRFIKKKAQLEKLLEHARVHKISRRGGTTQVKSRIKREIEETKKEKYVEKKMQRINFETGISHSKLMIRLDAVTKNYQTASVFKDLTFEIRGGEKLWLFGPNGAGKTTIVKLIMGEEQASAGNLKIGENINIGYFAQKQTALDYHKDLMTYFMEETGCYYGNVFAKLKRFMFDKDDLKKKIGNLSPGQRARFAFALFAYKNYDMLVLDEPDNHLDIDTKEVLEDSLREYKGTLLLISHDRFFVERAGVEKILNLRDGKLAEFTTA